jgi:hypothetical protein
MHARCFFTRCENSWSHFAESVIVFKTPPSHFDLKDMEGIVSRPGFSSIKSRLSAERQASTPTHQIPTSQYNRYNYNIARGAVVADVQPRQLHFTAGGRSLYDLYQPMVVANGATPVSHVGPRSGRADRQEKPTSSHKQGVDQSTQPRRAYSSRALGDASADEFFCPRHHGKNRNVSCHNKLDCPPSYTRSVAAKENKDQDSSSSHRTTRNRSAIAPISATKPMRCRALSTA